MKFTVDGKGYEFDLETLSLDEGEILEDYARIEVKDFMDALKATKVRAIRALVYIAKRRAGEDVRWADLGSLDLMGLAQSMVTENGTPTPVVAGAGEAAVASPDAAPVAKLRKAAARKPRAAKPKPEPESEPAAG